VITARVLRCDKIHDNEKYHYPALHRYFSLLLQTPHTYSHHNTLLPTPSFLSSPISVMISFPNAANNVLLDRTFKLPDLPPSPAQIVSTSCRTQILSVHVPVSTFARRPAAAVVTVSIHRVFRSLDTLFSGDVMWNRILSGCLFGVGFSVTILA
jgi:hypothetical protein